MWKVLGKNLLRAFVWYARHFNRSSFGLNWSHRIPHRHFFIFVRTWQTGVIRPEFIDEMNEKNSSAHSQLEEFDLGFHSICVTMQSLNIWLESSCSDSLRCVLRPHIRTKVLLWGPIFSPNEEFLTKCEYNWLSIHAWFPFETFTTIIGLNLDLRDHFPVTCRFSRIFARRATTLDWRHRIIDDMVKSATNVSLNREDYQ